MPDTPHELLNPANLSPAKGFSHIVLPSKGRTIYFGGQAAQAQDGSIVGETLVEQFGVALDNLSRALEAAGAEPRHLVQMQLFVTDAEEYRNSLRELAAVWQRRLGKHYPAMALFEIKGLFDAKAKVEIMSIAVVPD